MIITKSRKNSRKRGIEKYSRGGRGGTLEKTDSEEGCTDSCSDCSDKEVRLPEVSILLLKLISCCFFQLRRIREREYSFRKMDSVSSQKVRIGCNL